MNLFQTGVRPAIDDYLQKKSEEVRDYGSYWSASQAGYCMRKVIFERLGVPHVEKDSDARKQRLFEAGHIFHEWAQRITKDAGISIVQELELQDEDLMVRGHIDDLVLVSETVRDHEKDSRVVHVEKHLILYDYKTQNSRAFTYQKGRPISHFHKHQLGTYLLLLRRLLAEDVKPAELTGLPELSDSRILKISKDDLRMDENQLLWSDGLETEILAYWTVLNQHWQDRTLPACTCADQEGGFMAKDKYNPFYWNGEPCSLEWLALKKKEGVVK